MYSIAVVLIRLPSLFQLQMDTSKRILIGCAKFRYFSWCSYCSVYEMATRKPLSKTKMSTCGYCDTIMLDQNLGKHCKEKHAGKPKFVKGDTQITSLFEKNNVKSYQTMT